MTASYHVDDVYLKTLNRVLSEGVERKDRTGVGTISIFGTQDKYDLTKGFPLLTTKKVYTRGVLAELIFFLRGITNNNWLQDRKVTIWNEWAKEDGDLGPIYGYQWRNFGAPYVKQSVRDETGEDPGGVDQIMNLINGLRDNPFSRRHIVSSWNPILIDDMALPPCHTLFQLYVTPDANGEPYGLSCQLYQRSADMFLGVPFNIASYAALTHLLGDLVGLKPLEFVHTIGDAHIYSNHVEQVKKQLSRLEDKREMPTLRLEHPVELSSVDTEDPKFLDNYTEDCFVIEGYNPHPAIPAPIAK